MNAVRTHKSLLGTLLFGMLMSSMAPTKVHAFDFGSIVTKKRLAIAVPFAVLFLACSENAQRLTTKAYYKSKIAALKMLQHLPLSSDTHKKCTDLIEMADAECTTRSGSSFTGENLKTLLKDFKDLVDIFKNGKEILGWLS